MPLPQAVAAQDAFVSHSSHDRTIAAAITAGLQARELRVWLDESDIMLGGLLGKQLQDGIAASRVVILLWSAAAAASRWVSCEWLTAFHLDTFLIPCVLDDTPVPQCLRTAVWLPVHDVTPDVLGRLARAVRDAPAHRNPVAPPMRGEQPDLLRSTVHRINAVQQAVIAHLDQQETEAAHQIQATLDEATTAALAVWPYDPVLINLAAYHAKNAYLIRYWDRIQAGHAPEDDLLSQAENRFLDTLRIDPTDPSAINGLGSILFLQRDLDAAEFFIRAAIDEAARRGGRYPAAEEDLATLLHFRVR